MMADTNVKYLEYKGRALVREGDIICYGNMTDKCILYLMILDYRDAGGLKLPGKILIQVLGTENGKLAQGKIIKQGEKDGLFDAFDIGTVWLDRALAQ